MSLSRMTPLGSEVGLQVLLAVGSSSVVVRFANVAVGVALPVYQSVRSLEDRVQPYQRKWLGYWSVYGCLHAAEATCGQLISWIPLYHHLKLALLLWLQWPPEYGFVKVYCKVLRPLFHQYRRQVDPFLQGASRHVAAWEAAHRSELRALVTGFRQLASYVRSTVQQGIDAVRHSNTEGRAGAPPPSTLMEEYLAPPPPPAAPHDMAPASGGRQENPSASIPGSASGLGAAPAIRSSAADATGWVHVPPGPESPDSR